MRTITLEEHYATPAFENGPGTRLAFDETLVRQLSDLDGGRIAAMDAAGIDVQVLSLVSPGVEQLAAPDAVALARESNDVLADAVRRHPTRFAGFATVPTPSPKAAAEELERAVREYGFVGAVVNGHSAGRYLDDPFFAPLLERAAGLGVPIYLHPTLPPAPVVEASYGGLAPRVTWMLSMAAWGWHIETATHLLRLVLGGAFDRHPTLQVVIGHMGEALPFMMPRLERTLPTELTELHRPVGAYLRENVHYTFSGFNWLPTFQILLAEVGVERIMFSADHPFASMAEARTFLDGLPISPGDRDRIAHGNAEKLLHL
ncbi:amidohydrolase family protein [Pseudonocardia acidicola]|uniref:Amidohydrolase n=1 Tax=Pseudonocardia acidicola TaxID=2724939 RepID=A0ABX1SEW7_9PSEU|nr:amidohydrolase family protein [Pseudonocardia acidicola]NMH99033.1 amidohydrolase [Pseudonocardia acidicola]